MMFILPDDQHLPHFIKIKVTCKAFHPDQHCVLDEGRLSTNGQGRLILARVETAAIRQRRSAHLVVEVEHLNGAGEELGLGGDEVQQP